MKTVSWDDVLPIATPAIHARSRPRAVLGLWVTQGVLALLGTWPVVSLVRAAYGRHPRGDGPLWDPGGHALFALVDREANGLSAAAGTAAAVLVVGAFLGIVPVGALLVSVSHATRGGRGIGPARSTGLALRLVPSFALMLAGVLLTQGLVIAAGLFTADLIEAWTHRGLGEAAAQQLAAAIVVPWVLAAFALGVVHDLARAAMVRRDLRAIDALFVGVRAFLASPVGVSWSWAWRAGAGLGPIAAVAFVAAAVGANGSVAAATLLALGVLHQSVVLGRTALHASWLAKALRIVDWASGERPNRAPAPSSGDPSTPGDVDALDAAPDPRQRESER